VGTGLTGGLRAPRPSPALEDRVLPCLFAALLPLAAGAPAAFAQDAASPPDSTIDVLDSLDVEDADLGVADEAEEIDPALRLDGIDEQLQALQGEVDRLRKFKFSGYIQARYDIAEADADTVKVSGSPATITPATADVSLLAYRASYANWSDAGFKFFNDASFCRGIEVPLSVDPKGPAAAAGLKETHKIVAINGRRIHDKSCVLIPILLHPPPGTSIELELLDGTKLRFKTMAAPPPANGNGFRFEEG